MASTYSQIQLALNEIVSRINDNRNRIAQARAIVSTAVSDLTSMGTQYGPTVTDLNALATAEPTNVASATAKAQMDKLVAEFTALQTTANTLKTAIGS